MPNLTCGSGRALRCALLSSRPTQQWSGHPPVVWNGHCDFTEGKPVTTICLASSTIGKAICRCSGRPSCRKRPAAPSYASDSWSQITGSRDLGTPPVPQYGRRWLGARGPLVPAPRVGLALHRTASSEGAWPFSCIEGSYLAAYLPHGKENQNRRSRSSGTSARSPAKPSCLALTKPLRWKEPGRIQGAGHEADGDTAMTRRKGEITRGDLKPQIAASRGAPGRKGAGPHEQVR
jgi:hypothetical protein